MMGIGEESTWQTSGIEDSGFKMNHYDYCLCSFSLGWDGVDHCRPRLGWGFMDIL